MNYEKLNVTSGTWVAIAANLIAALVAAMQAFDWSTMVGPQGAAWVIVAIAVLNGLAHYLTGPGAVTTGTIWAVALNALIAVVAVLQGLDWINVVGSQGAGVAAMVITFANLVLHYFSGNALPAPAPSR